MQKQTEIDVHAKETSWVKRGSKSETDSGSGTNVEREIGTETKRKGETERNKQRSIQQSSSKQRGSLSEAARPS